LKLIVVSSLQTPYHGRLLLITSNSDVSLFLLQGLFYPSLFFRRLFAQPHFVSSPSHIDVGTAGSSSLLPLLLAARVFQLQKKQGLPPDLADVKAEWISSLKLKSFSDLLRLILQQTVESLSDGRWEVRRMGQQVDPFILILQGNYTSTLAVIPVFG
jgi:hypothetical protein